MLQNQRSFLILVFILLVSSLLSCKSKYEIPKDKTVFRYNESAGISSLDPAFARNQANIWAVNQLFNGLVQFDDQLQPQPCIARSWEISPDGKTYTFHLRNDVFFHENEIFEGKTRKVVAQDFVYSLNRIVDPKLASPGAWIFYQVEVKDGKHAFAALDDSTFQIRLKSPFPPFLGLLSMAYCVVVPHEAVEKLGDAFRKQPVGTGPFQFKMWKEGIKLVLIKNEHYFETDSSGNRLPYLDAVAINFLVDKQAAFLEFVKGNLDFMSGIDASYKDEMLTYDGKLSPKYSGRIHLQKAPYLNTEYLGIQVDSTLDLVKKSPLRMKKIRQALNYGFDRQKMMRYLRNSIGIPATKGFVPYGIPYFDHRKISGYDYHPEKAKQLLAEAGFPGGKGLPPITLTTNASYVDLCKYIQSQWNELGFDVKIDITPPATLRQQMAQSQVMFFRGSWIADYPDAENYLAIFYSPNFCPQGPNYTHFSNLAFDRLFQKANNEPNDSIRAGIYEEMDNLVMQEAPVVVLYYDQLLRFTQKTVHNFSSNPLNLLNLKQVKKDIPG